MKKIYAPWRHGYVSKTVHSEDSKRMKNDCVFCHAFEQKDGVENLVVKRYEHCAIVMNRYPYNSGHLMIIPFAHKPELHDVNRETRAEMMEVINFAMEALKQTMPPHGFNVGMNIGSAGGGGLPSHIHFHVIPRWKGDTNFLATTADTKVVCTAFEKVYNDLKKTLN